MRRTLFPRSPAFRAAAVAAIVLSPAGVVACGEDSPGSEAGADVEDIVEDQPVLDEPVDGEVWDGLDRDFSDELGSYVGQEVRLSATVDEVITPAAFTIADPDDAAVEPLLVLSSPSTAEVAPDDSVGVTGTVREGFGVAEAEEALGVDLDDQLLADYADAPYVVADSVEVLG